MFEFCSSGDDIKGMSVLLIEADSFKLPSN